MAFHYLFLVASIFRVIHTIGLNRKGVGSYLFKQKMLKKHVVRRTHGTFHGLFPNR